MRKSIVFLWNFMFDHEKSPLRHIPDIGTRHMVLQLLGCDFLRQEAYNIFATRLEGPQYGNGVANKN